MWQRKTLFVWLPSWLVRWMLPETLALIGNSQLISNYKVLNDSYCTMSDDFFEITGFYPALWLSGIRDICLWYFFFPFLATLEELLFGCCCQSNTLKFWTNTYGPQRMNPNDFGDNLSPSCATMRLTFLLFSKMARQLFNGFTFDSDIDDAQRINPNNFGDCLNFPLA